MNNAVFRQAAECLAGDAFYGFRRPVGSHVGEYLRGTGELMAEQHRYAVQTVIFGGDDKRFAYAVPVKRTIEQRFGGIAIRVLIGPVALALEAGGNGVVAQRFFN